MKQLKLEISAIKDKNQEIIGYSGFVVNESHPRYPKGYDWWVQMNDIHPDPSTALKVAVKKLPSLLESIQVDMDLVEIPSENSLYS